jgi:hypothetical protein
MPALSASAPGKVILFGEPRKASLSAVARRLKADEANPNMDS